VAQAAVIGVPDLRWGEVGCAFVVLRDEAETTAQEIADWSRGYLAGYQRPKHFLFCGELPVGHSGKIDKKSLRLLAAERIVLQPDDDAID
jgi:acyl-CoA synthetase (AMP-forming)/AMP-acid ligase II